VEFGLFEADDDFVGFQCQCSGILITVWHRRFDTPFAPVDSILNDLVDNSRLVFSATVDRWKLAQACKEARLLVFEQGLISFKPLDDDYEHLDCTVAVPAKSKYSIEIESKSICVFLESIQGEENVSLKLLIGPDFPWLRLGSLCFKHDYYVTAIEGNL
jgi:hypothetical protein